MSYPLIAGNWVNLLVRTSFLEIGAIAKVKYVWKRRLLTFAVVLVDSRVRGWFWAGFDHFDRFTKKICEKRRIFLFARVSSEQVAEGQRSTGLKVRIVQKPSRVECDVTAWRHWSHLDLRPLDVKKGRASKKGVRDGTCSRSQLPSSSS